MSDLISRKALSKKIYEWQEDIHDNEYDAEKYDFVFEQIYEMLDTAPTVEAKPVVHCKDCEHWGTGVAGETEHVKCCEYGKYMVGENGFCCYADMRGGKND